MTKQERKQKSAIKRLREIFEGDGIKVKEYENDIADLNLYFKKRKYPVSVVRKESIPNSTLEKEKHKNDILMFRKNREDWKVYMDANTLLLLLLNNRS